ncbi:kinase-like domain-containing protein [Pilobolus umbonatus]|nr:kinase-like domain-containing protein [Pilobolus umbonatus]
MAHIRNRIFNTMRKHIDLTLEDMKSEQLHNMPLAEIIDICRERNLSTEGSKSELIIHLLDYKDNTLPIPAPSTPSLSPELDDNYMDIGILRNRRHIMNSKDFSLLFLDGNGSHSLSLSDLKFGEKIGCGAFKDCYEGFYKGERVAIGKLRLTPFNEFNLAEIKHEINVLKQLRHENVTQFIGVCTHPDHLCIVTEICSRGDLFDLIRRNTRPSFSQQVSFMYDIAMGVSYLHTRRPSIIHRDLKSPNILISSDNRAKINDFGMARIRPRANALIHTHSPEFFQPNPCYTEKVYACGLIFWEIITWGNAGYPYQGLNEHELAEAIRKDKRPPTSELFRSCPTNLIMLIMEMWATAPPMRPSMNQVIERLSPYMI